MVLKAFALRIPIVLNLEVMDLIFLFNTFYFSSTGHWTFVCVKYINSILIIDSMNNDCILNKCDLIELYKSRDYKYLDKYSTWFPVLASPQLAGIVADLMGDGHLQGNPKWRIDYCSKSLEELARFNEELYSLFKIKGKIRECKTNYYKTFNLGVNNKVLARILNKIGVPSGSKVFSSFNIPKWILADKRCFSRFVNRLFSCEGSVDVNSKCIEIKMYKSEDLMDEGIAFFQILRGNLYNYYGIETTRPFLEGRINIRKDGFKTIGIWLKIKKRDSLDRFYVYIGFDDPNKNIKLRKIISISQ